MVITPPITPPAWIKPLITATRNARTPRPLVPALDAAQLTVVLARLMSVSTTYFELNKISSS